MPMERMNDFFTARAENYDEHMLNEVVGCREGYVKMAELLPASARTLLDLGCGTGLELAEIFRLNPSVKVTGIDLTDAMLNKLRRKFPEKDLTLINADYFACDFGTDAYDAAVSFQTMHHFSHADKTRLYQKIYRAIKPAGLYVECDFVALNREAEELCFAEYERARKMQHAPDGALYHFDTPCTVENQLRMLREAGFLGAELVWKMGNTAMFTAEKR